MAEEINQPQDNPELNLEERTKVLERTLLNSGMTAEEVAKLGTAELPVEDARKTVFERMAAQYAKENEITGFATIKDLVEQAQNEGLKYAHHKYAEIYGSDTSKASWIKTSPQEGESKSYKERMEEFFKLERKAIDAKIKRLEKDAHTTDSAIREELKEERARLSFLEKELEEKEGKLQHFSENEIPRLQQEMENTMRKERLRGELFVEYSLAPLEFRNSKEKLKRMWKIYEDEFHRRTDVGYDENGQVVLRDKGANRVKRNADGSLVTPRTIFEQIAVEFEEADTTPQRGIATRYSEQRANKTTDPNLAKKMERFQRERKVKGSF